MLHRALRAAGICIILSAAAAEAQAQAFANAQSSAAGYTTATHTARVSCAGMSNFVRKDLFDVGSTDYPAKGKTPRYCQIKGKLRPEIAFEVSMPEKWNGRFYMIGNGGHAGDSLDDPSRVAQREEALAMGFAFAQTNTGHDSRKEPGGTFVVSDPQKAIDYAWRAVHLTASMAKEIVRLHYARPPDRSYWNSCSNGGRQGLLEAQRFPEDFDGILANAPWVDQTGFTMGTIWNQRAVAGVGLTPGKLATLATKVMERCDAIDGLKDGLIDDPRKCDFDALTMVNACPAGEDGDGCLTSAQAEAVMKVYGGPVSQGKSLFPGFMPGSEAVVTGGFGNTGPASAWMNTIVASSPTAKPADFNLGEATMRYLVFSPPDPGYDTGSFDFDKDPKLLEGWASKANAKNPNLDGLRKRGGKVLMTYGWADQILQPLMGVHYYEQVQARYGAKTGDFVRLFMVPGMTHCAGGYGTDRFDALTALIDWVEKGNAPNSLAASRVVDGKVVRTRPLCPYPQVARYSGSGSIDEAANFSCATP